VSSERSIPDRCDVVVIGGGPAGSCAAALLAKAGFDTVLFDKVRHPRPQVGESLIPHFWKFADQVGVSETIAQDGFVQKAGGIVVWDGEIRQTTFSDFGFTRPALHVERDRFDEILLRHSERQGVKVYELVNVRGAEFGDPARPVVRFDDRRDGSSRAGTITARFVIDASGMGTVVASGSNARHRVGSDGKYLGVWGYFRGGHYVAADRRSHPVGDVTRLPPVTFVTSYPDGWTWHIPMRDVTSVGLVVDTAVTRGQGRSGQERYFLDRCRTLPYLRELLQEADYIEDSLTFRPDYSYYSDRITGPGFVCAGDAASFVDPIFSQGVVFAMYSGCLSAWAARAVLEVPRREAFYRAIYQERTLQFYGFARLLAFGDFGGEGVDPEAVRQMVLSMPRHELELSLTASTMTNRSENLRRILMDAGYRIEQIREEITDRSETLDALGAMPASRVVRACPT
jgi:flavin-dependent dehydrogenase